MPRPKRKDWRAGKTKKEIQTIVDKRNATRKANKAAGKATLKEAAKRVKATQWAKAQKELCSQKNRRISQSPQPTHNTLTPLMDLAKEVYELSKIIGECEVAIQAGKGSLFVTITANQIDKDPIIGN